MSAAWSGTPTTRAARAANWLSNPLRRAAISLGRTGACGAHRGSRGIRERGGIGPLLRVASTRLAHRGLGVAAKPAHLVACGAGGQRGQGRRAPRAEPAAGRHTGAATAWCPIAGSSGRAAAAACTIASATTWRQGAGRAAACTLTQDSQRNPGAAVSAGLSRCRPPRVWRCLAPGPGNRPRRDHPPSTARGRSHRGRRGRCRSGHCHRAVGSCRPSCRP